MPSTRIRLRTSVSSWVRTIPTATDATTPSSRVLAEQRIHLVVRQIDEQRRLGDEPCHHGEGRRAADGGQPDQQRQAGEHQQLPIGVAEVADDADRQDDRDGERAATRVEAFAAAQPIGEEPERRAR